MFLDFVLVIFEDAHILDFVFFGILEQVAVLFHEGSLDVLELLVDDYLLQSCNHLIEKDFLRGWWICLWLKDYFEPKFRSLPRYCRSFSLKGSPITCGWFAICPWVGWLILLFLLILILYQTSIGVFDLSRSFTIYMFTIYIDRLPPIYINDLPYKSIV